MNPKPDYKIGQKNEFIIEDYNHTKPFSSFLPGIAGIDGIPMWTFYVNRNQAVCSFGIGDKDHSMMEFLPANLAYQLVGTQGFRTFIKIINKTKFVFYEPFRSYEPIEEYTPLQKMIITPYSVSIEEVNEKIGLSFKVEYCNAANEPFPALIRQLEIRNISKKGLRVEILDGIAQVIPYGMDDYNLKKMKYLVKSFSMVENLEDKVPYFHVKTVQEDSPNVTVVKKGHFFIYFKAEDKKSILIRPFVDSSQIFGIRKDFIVPSKFIEKAKFKYNFKKEITNGELPTSMCLDSFRLAPKDTLKYCCVCGAVDSIKEIKKVSQRAVRPKFFGEQLEKNKILTESLMSNSLTLSQKEKFDRYCNQNFLDNVLRGGWPITISKKQNKIFYVYSRKHGDLERDYNQFYISPTVYSQGDANYRDINQNRRNDLFFKPDTGMMNILNFINFVQIDGFNPLGIKGTSYIFKGTERMLKDIFYNSLEIMRKFLKEPFMPGDFFKFIDKNSIKMKGSKIDTLSKIIDQSEAVQNSRHIEGFWSDHWAYNLDLIESFLSLYPEKRKKLFIDYREFKFYDSPYIVSPRTDKYVLWDKAPIQLGSVRLDDDKKKMILERKSEKNILRKDNGKGEPYKTNLLTKLFTIAINKILSIGPDGCGIEMESDKPDWCDSLNGLPGLFGSSTNETFELRRLIRLIIENINLISKKYSFDLPEEIFDVMEESKKILIEYFKKKPDDFSLWDKLTKLKEEFRENTKFGIKGKFTKVSSLRILKYLQLINKRLDIAINKSFDKKAGLYFAYFVNIPIDYEIIKYTDERGKKIEKKNYRELPCIKIKKFNSRPLPHFLEAQVHALRTEKDKSKARKIHLNVFKSKLLDKKLKMFCVNESLDKETYEIGRIKTFVPGWLENQSIWLHMEYKYILELLKAGLYEDFYKNIENVLVPFLRPEVYGRCIFENSSFIVSSIHPDKKIHGNGFYARLSGSTAEFIHIWIIMMTGGNPFRLDRDNKLYFKLSPVLKKDYFIKKAQERSYYLPDGTSCNEILKKGTLKFIFLGKIPVTYFNPKLKDTFGASGVRAVKYKLTLDNGKTKEFTDKIPQAHAILIRERKVKEIKVFLS